MKTQESIVNLRSLHIRSTNGDIVLACTEACFEVLRTKLGASRGSTIRFGTFDFICSRKGLYIGTPDERNEASKSEAFQVCRSILGAYRATKTFEIVFPDDQSYRIWYTANRRAPTGRDLSDLAHKMGIHIPFMGIPYDDSKAAKAVPYRTTLQVKTISQIEVKTPTPSAEMASVDALRNLQALFTNRSSK